MVVGDTRRCWDQLSRHCSRDGDSQVVLDKLRRQKQVITTIVRNKVPCWSSPSNDRQLWCLETKENLVLVFGRRWCLVQTRCSSEAASFSSSAAFKAMKQLLRQQLKATQVEPLLRAPSSSFKLLETPSYTLMYTPSWRDEPGLRCRVCSVILAFPVPCRENQENKKMTSWEETCAKNGWYFNLYSNYNKTPETLALLAWCLFWCLFWCHRREE